MAGGIPYASHQPEGGFLGLPVAQSFLSETGHFDEASRQAGFDLGDIYLKPIIRDLLEGSKE